MRKLVVSEFITLDGVVQAPGALRSATPYRTGVVGLHYARAR